MLLSLTGLIQQSNHQSSLIVMAALMMLKNCWTSRGRWL